MDKKGILRVLVIVLALGLALLPAGNVKAEHLDGATVPFMSPEDWYNLPGDAPYAAFLDSMQIRWDVYQLVEGAPDPELAGANIDPDAKFVTTFSVGAVTGPANFIGVNVVSFSNVSLAGWDYLNPGASISAPGNEGAVGYFAPTDANDSAISYVGIDAETVDPDDPLYEPDPLSPNYIDMGAYVAFGLNPPVKGGHGSATGWIATGVNPLTTYNALCKVSVLLVGDGETYEVEVSSIFGDDPNETMPPVPEPTTLLLLGSGLVLSGILRKKIVL